MKGRTVRLEDMCDLVAEAVRPSARPDALYLGLEHLTSGRLVRIGSGQASEMRSNMSAFQPGDVLYGKLRPYLDKAVLADKQGVCTTELLVLRAKEDMDPRFLATVVHAPSFLRYAVAGTTGVQHPRTSWAHIREFEVPEFAFDEQQQIADLLWLVHEVISRTEALAEEGQTFKRVTMRELFTRGLRGEAQKDTEIAPMPESWRTAQLGQVAEVISTRMAYTELKRIPQAFGKDTIRVLGIKVADMNLPGNEVELQSAALERIVRRDIAYQRCAPPRTIIFPKRGAAIATNKKRISKEWTVFDPNVIGVVAGSELCQDFLFQWFQMFDLRTITDLGPTPQLNKKNLLPLNVPIPSTMDEQREIADILDAIDRKIDLHRRKSAVLDELFKALLHQLMAGEISFSELDLSELDRKTTSEFTQGGKR